MGKKEKYTKEELVGKAVEMVREKGFDNLGIRSLADYAGVSTQPICRHFGNIKELNACVLSAINDLYEDFLKKEVQSGQYPPYKASGIGYVNFARKEPELFKALFMRSRKNEDGKKAKEWFMLRNWNVKRQLCTALERNQVRICLWEDSKIQDGLTSRENSMIPWKIIRKNL